MPQEISSQIQDLASLNREKARLRLIGVIVLFIGLVTAGIVYWLGSRPRPAEDIAMQEYEESQARAESRQMETLYGTSGGIVEDFLHGLKRPANQALLIVAISGLVAGACFCLGRPFSEEEAR